MYLYLDESGNLGFNPYHRHSAYFVITILAAQDFSLFKNAVKRTLRTKVNYNRKKRIVNELKGSNTTFEIKRYFYNLLKANEEWNIHTIILDKKKIGKKIDQLTNTEELYNVLSKILIQGINLPENSSIIQLYIDKRKTKNEIDIFNNYIKLNITDVLPNKVILNIEHLDSEKNAGIQAVDMFCYGIARKYEFNDTRWYDLFKDRIKKEVIYRP